jgi:hypothetical protein
MHRAIQRDTAVQSLNTLAARGPSREPERSQFSWLLRLFLERFFNHENSSASGEGLGRLIQLACVAGLPGFIVALYLWPAYHPFPGWPPGRHSAGLPTYWAQANHHLFFVLYSFVVTGLIVVFEWDLLFPDLLDVFVLGPLPVPWLRQFLARVSAIAIFIAGLLLDANILGLLVLPVATEPRQVSPLMLGHFFSVASAGLFSAGLVLALQGMLLALLGERLYQRFSVLLQTIMVTAFLIPLLLFPVLSGVTPALLQSYSSVSEFFPPFWFLALFQQYLPGASLSDFSMWSRLGHIGVVNTLLIWAIAIAAYPIAHLRRVRSLIQGSSSLKSRNYLRPRWEGLLQATILRAPRRSAVFHFISQTLLRLPRYRIYLALSGGVCLSIVVATILRLEVVHGVLVAASSPDGYRIAIGIVAFWVLAGLRISFLSPGNQQGGWIFRTIHGRPPHYEAALEQLQAAPLWAFLAAAVVIILFICGFQFVAPPELRTPFSLAAQLVTGVGFCLILADIVFLNVASLPFVGDRSSDQHNLSFTVLRYLTFFPVVTTAALICEHQLERGPLQLGAGVATVAAIHFWLRKWHRDFVRLECSQVALEEGEDDFPLKLGLRY